MAGPLKTLASKLTPKAAPKPAPRRDVAMKPTFPIGNGGRRDIAIKPKPRGK